MDIFNITKSKTREKILKLFFSDTGKKYYLREIEKILNISVGNIRRELLYLESAGLFQKERLGKQVYYFLNKKSPIFEDFKRIVSKTIGVEAIIKEKLDALRGIEVAFIYGSFAGEKEDAFSDIDIFIIGRVGEDNLLSAVQGAEKDLSREINYVIFAKDDLANSFKRDSAFLRDVISGKKVFLIGNKNDLEKIIRRGKNSEKKH